MNDSNHQVARDVYRRLHQAICGVVCGQDHPLDRLEPCALVDDILQLRRAVQEIRVSEEISRYIVNLVGATRKTQGVRFGASPRASIALMKTSQALAFFDGSNFVTPDHVEELAIPVLSH